MTRVIRLAPWAVACALLFGTPGVAEAQVAHSFDELQLFGRLKPGDKVSLQGPLGERATGVFRGWRAGSLDLYVPGEKRDATFKEQDVAALRRAGTHGAAWGAAIGAASGVVVTALAASSYGENEGGRFCGGCFLQWSAIGVPTGVGIGAGIGFALDLLRRETLYVSSSRSFSIGVSPLVSRKATGLRVALQF